MGKTDRFKGNGQAVSVGRIWLSAPHCHSVEGYISTEPTSTVILSEALRSRRTSQSTYWVIRCFQWVTEVSTKDFNRIDIRSTVGTTFPASLIFLWRRGSASNSGALSQTRPTTAGGGRDGLVEPSAPHSAEGGLTQTNVQAAGTAAACRSDQPGSASFRAPYRSGSPPGGNRPGSPSDPGAAGGPNLFRW